MDALVRVRDHPSLCTCAVRSRIYFLTRENVTPNSKPRVCFPFESSAKQFRQGMRFPRYLVHGGIACPDGTGSTNFNFHYTPLPDSVDVFPKYAKRLIWISMVISTLYAFPLPPTLLTQFPIPFATNNKTAFHCLLFLSLLSP